MSHFVPRDRRGEAGSLSHGTQPIKEVNAGNNPTANVPRRQSLRPSSFRFQTPTCCQLGHSLYSIQCYKGLAHLQETAKPSLAVGHAENAKSSAMKRSPLVASA